MMQFANRHIQTAATIIEQYDGTMPLHHYLKQFFAADKKYGSKDRKSITHACYCFYRLGKALKDIPVSEKIKAGIFLCNDEPRIWKSVFEENWLANWKTGVHQRISYIQTQLPFELPDVFPLHSNASDTIDKNAFIVSHLLQPDLYIRIRPGKEKKVIDQLLAASVPYRSCDESCIALPNSTKIDDLLALNKDAVVQDLSSQRIAEFLSTVNSQLPSVKVWDCCAASGGKSILAVDILQNIDLTVSDIRQSIIQNLKKRFAEAGIHHYRSFVADVSDPAIKIDTKYDLIICDVPCSGSGTWSRTPEQLTFFAGNKIGHYTSLQEKITRNVIQAVKTGGYLLYITCSVFKEENEEMVKFILSNSSLQLSKMEYLEGYDKKADTMFAALFTA